MSTNIKSESIDKLLSLSKKELEKVFSELSLSEIEDLISKLKEEVK